MTAISEGEKENQHGGDNGSSRSAKDVGEYEIGAVLRREGLYSSHLTKGRQDQAGGMLDGLAPQKRGTKSKASIPVTHGGKLPVA